LDFLKGFVLAVLGFLAVFVIKYAFCLMAVIFVYFHIKFREIITKGLAFCPAA
jgi:hypothetical protein